MKKKHIEKTELEKRLEAETAAEGSSGEEASDTSQEAEAAGVDVTALQAERDTLNDRLLRTLAEFDNYRKRTAREHDRMRRTAAASLVSDLLAVVDNLERALTHRDGDGFADGVEMVLKQMRDVLHRHGVEPIPAVGQPFDPDVHEAIMMTQSDEHPCDHVVQELQKGYRLGDQVLRPAKVAVNMRQDDAGQETVCGSGSNDTVAAEGVGQ